MKSEQTNKITKPKTITIIGGNGKMGNLFAQALKKEKNINILISDHKTKLTNIEATKQSDIIIITVPITKTCEVIEKIGPHIKDGAMITDFTSVKINPINSMKKSTKQNKNIEILGGHPLFGPTAGFKNQNIILCQETKGKYYNWYKQFLKKQELKVIEMTAKEHDKNMAIIQGLTHLSNISLGHTITKLNCNLKSIEEISTPIYLMGIFNVGRILAQDEQLYSDIQMENPYTIEVSNNYYQAVKELNQTIEKRDKQNFKKIFNNSKTFFNNILTKSMEITDKLIKGMKQ